MPRPVQLPLVAWIAWRQPWTRGILVTLVGAEVAVVIATGYAEPWLGRLLTLSDGQVAAWFNFGPSRFFGAAWMPIGACLATYLLWKGRPGWAGLAFAPYLLGQYWLFALLGRDQPVAHRRPGPDRPWRARPGQDEFREQIRR